VGGRRVGLPRPILQLPEGGLEDGYRSWLGDIPEQSQVRKKQLKMKRGRRRRYDMLP